MLSGITKADLAELRALKNPPQLVVELLSLLAEVLGFANWYKAKNSPNLALLLLNFNPESLSYDLA